MKLDRNRLHNIKNPNQGEAKKVLCVCSAGLLRSPTAAELLSRSPYNFNTRSAGVTTGYALVPVDQYLIEWADEIVCMEKEHAKILEPLATGKKIITLDIPDNYAFRDPELQKMIVSRYNLLSKGSKI